MRERGREGEGTKLLKFANLTIRNPDLQVGHICTPIGPQGIYRILPTPSLIPAHLHPTDPDPQLQRGGLGAGDGVSPDLLLWSVVPVLPGAHLQVEDAGMVVLRR